MRRLGELNTAAKGKAPLGDSNKKDGEANAVFTLMILEIPIQKEQLSRGSKPCDMSDRS